MAMERIREIAGFVASVSPQVRASLAATYRVKDQEAGWMIEQLLSGPLGLRSGGDMEMVSLGSWIPML
jgi:hypothetical protein